jgi:hybrid cluster-associated redox disulfide protein
MKMKRQSSKPAKPKTVRPRIDATMNVLEIIALHPEASDILAAYGLHCHNCAFSTMDSLEDGARSHGLTDDDIDNMVQDLTELLENAPVKSKTFTLTLAAAKALQDIAHQEKKDTCLLHVLSDGSGGFCLEFGDALPEGDSCFNARGVEGVMLSIAPNVLQRVGGGAVDFREGRFKLDLPQTDACACTEKTCAC